MDPRFNPIYEKIYENFPPDHDEWKTPMIDKLQSAIEAAIASLKPSMNVRSDALLFLLINFHEMVARPLINASLLDFNPLVTEEALLDGIRQDLEDIIKGAQKICLTEHEDEIEPKHLMKYIVEAWEHLKINSLGWWN